VTTQELVSRWIVAFTLTQCVECFLYVRVFRVRLWVAFAASTITHPIVVFVIPKLWAMAYLALIGAFAPRTLSPDAYFVIYGALAETFAIAVEAAWLAWRARFGLRKAFVVSLLTNVASSSVGGLCFLVTGWP